MYDSLNLQDLHEQFTCTTGSGLKVYNFFEERPTRLVGIGFFQWTKLVSVKDIDSIVVDTKQMTSVWRSSRQSTSTPLRMFTTSVWLWIILT